MRPVRVSTACAVAALVALCALGAPVALAAPAAADPGAAPAASPAGVAERALRGASDVAPTIRRDRSGRVRSVTAKAGHPLRRPARVRAGAPAEAVARAFLDQYGASLGLVDGDAALATHQVVPAGKGDRIVRFQQRLGGVPVIGGDVIVTTRATGQVLNAAGEVTPQTAGPDEPVVGRDRAIRTAVQYTARAEHAAVAGLRAEASRWMYDPALIGAPGQGVRQVWRVEVTDGVDVRRLVLVDAALGTVALSVDLHAHARDRQVCDYLNVALDSSEPDCGPTEAGFVRGENSAAAAVQDVNDAYEFSGATYDFYARHFGRDSIDDEGMPLRSSVRVCFAGGRCPYPNAYWSGDKMVYGAGFAGADDVVGHELTHGVTEYTSGLFYAYQSGAINESFSDVMGEFIDQQYGNGTTDGPQYDWLLGEDLPASVGVIRDMADPTRFGDPDRMTSPDYAGEAHRDDAYLPDDSGGVHRNSGIGNKAAYLMTAPGTRTFNGVTVTGLGIDKAAQIYYRTMYLLTSGADYADLAAALDQACQALATEGVAGIAAADCVQVRAATTAVEMTAQPTSALAQAPEAAQCSRPTSAPSAEKEDDFDGAHAGWSVTGTSNGSGFAYTQGYARSGRWALYGQTGDGPGTSRHTAAWTPISVPTARSTYVWFAHTYQFDAGQGHHYDGGRVEYSLDGSTTWSDAAALFVANGYDVNLDGTAGAGTGRAFGGDSHGYRSSRLDLTGLGGHTVRLRFAAYGDAQLSSLWLIDDVRVYHCVDAATTSAVRRLRAAASAPGAVALTWYPPESAAPGGVTGYRVSGAGSPVTVSAGGPLRTVVTGVGSGAALTVTPISGAAAGPAETVTARSATVRLTPSVGAVAYGRAATLTGQVTVAAGGQPSGTATVFGRPRGTVMWTRLGAAPIYTTGRFALTHAPSATYEYMARTADGANLVGAASPTTALAVVPKLSLRASAAVVSRGAAVRFTGVTTPAYRYARTYLQAYYAGAWHTIATSQTSASGAVSIAPRLRTPGRFAYRAVVAGGLRFAQGISANVVVQTR